MQGRNNVKRGFPSFWGDGSDGILTAGATYLAGTDFDKYSGFCIKQYSEINWNPATAQTITVDQPCRGLILFVDGDVNIGANATISMAKMGSILPANPAELIDLYGASAQMRRIVDVLKTLKGGAGGDGGDAGTYGGDGGTGGTGRVCQGGIGGGGGGGTNSHTYHGGDGGSVEYPEVLPGCGGHVRKGETNGFNGGGGGGNGYFSEIEKWHGPGGRAYGAGGGGGAGYLGTNATNGEHTGGFVLLIAKGYVTIAGAIDVTGGKGGNGGTGGDWPAGGGGGAGGGVIAVFARGSINTTAATNTLTGGAGGSGYQSGTAGGQGTYYEEQIAV